ncbi:MAG: VWA domain-containing protein [Bacteroidetes bacterium]|nr:VWA domain-containing protein [Bacteroidota bacterium]
MIQKSKVLFLFFIFNFSFLIFNSAFAQPSPQKTRILFVFDDSFSMFGDWQSDKKIVVAKKLMSEFLDSLMKNNSSDIEIALRVYGHQTSLWPGPVNCEDTKLEVPFATTPVSAPKMKKVINALIPTGTTPIAFSLGKAAYDFPPDKNSRNIIILITDGIEECNGDPCAVSLELQKKGVIIKPFVIGIGLDLNFADAFKCIGKFYDASSEAGFKNILNVVVAQAMNNTTAEVDLLDINKKPTETDVAVTFYDEFSGAIRYNFMHTLNILGNPDTIFIDPIGTYKMVVHTIPEVQKKGIKITPGKHNKIFIDAPQGYLSLKVGDNVSSYGKLECIVRKNGEMQTLHVQNFNSYEKYLIGKYDLEILSLPRIKFSNVEINQSKTTTIEIPQAGTASIYKPGPGPSSIYLEEKNELKWVCNLNTNAMQESLVLQPGKYRIIYRPNSAKETFYSIEKKFSVESNAGVQIKLY